MNNTIASSSGKEDPYKILGVSEGANWEEIQEAHRTKMRKLEESKREVKAAFESLFPNRLQHNYLAAQPQAERWANQEYIPDPKDLNICNTSGPHNVAFLGQ